MIRVERSLVHKPVSPDPKHRARSKHRSCLGNLKTNLFNVYSSNYIEHLKIDKRKEQNLIIENPYPLNTKRRL